MLKTFDENDQSDKDCFIVLIYNKIHFNYRVRTIVYIFIKISIILFAKVLHTILF